MTKDTDTVGLATHQQELLSLWDAIAHRDAQLLKLLESSAQIVWLTDASGSVIIEPPQAIAHLTWGSFTGMDQQSTYGYGWLTAVHPDDVSTVRTVIERARASDQSFQFEMRVRDRRGDWRWMTARGSAMRSNNGAIAGWIGTCTDITSLKHTEEALRQSQQRLQAALEAGEMGTWIWNLQDNTFWWDEASVVLWGRVGNEVDHHNFETLLEHIHEADRPAVLEAVAKFVGSNELATTEFRTLRPDGALQWLSSRGRLERDDQGNPVRAVGAFIDITKFKAAEESLRQAQKMQALGTLAGGIAHDFNNLLLAISGNTRLALADIAAAHPAYTALVEIGKASERATDLVRRILAFAARTPRETTYTPLCAGVQDALNLARVSIPRNITLRTRLCDASANVNLSTTELQQIVINLITNAVHAIGDRPGVIEATVDLRDYEARIAVRDNGSGMDARTRDRVFDPFFTTKPSGQGTGLGLAVVHGIVQSARGSVYVDSEPGVGSTFIMHLPLSREARAEQQKQQAIPRGTGERILYVDDDEAIAILIDRTLTGLGYSVRTYTDSRLAAEVIAENCDAFDIVVTDLSMPGPNGFDIARAVRRVSATKPIVITSGYVRDQDREQAAVLGIQHLILKPNTIDELGQVLDSLCKQLSAQPAT